MKKNVYIIIGTLGNGGAERVVANLSKKLHMTENYNVNIVMFGFRSRIDYDYGGNLIYLDRESGKGLINKLKIFFSRIYKLKKMKNKDEKGIYISFLEYPNILNVLSSTKKNKTILSVRNHMSTKHKEGVKSIFWNLSIKYFYPSADKIVAVSKTIKEDLIKNYKIPVNMVEVIYNGHNEQYILEQGEIIESNIFSDILMQNSNAKFIIHIGRFNPQKDHLNLLKMMYQLIRLNSNVHLILLGEGRMERQIRNRIEDLNIEKHVHLEGFVSNPYSYLANSDLMVLTSKHEGFPNVLLEAMFFGLPIVSTNCYSGPSEILAESRVENTSYGLKNAVDLNYAGVLYPVLSSNEKELRYQSTVMAKEINAILNNPELYDFFSKKSFLTSKKFTEESFFKKWLIIIEES